MFVEGKYKLITDKLTLNMTNHTHILKYWSSLPYIQHCVEPFMFTTCSSTSYHITNIVPCIVGMNEKAVNIIHYSN